MRAYTRMPRLFPTVTHLKQQWALVLAYASSLSPRNRYMVTDKVHCCCYPVTQRGACVDTIKIPWLMEN